MCAKIISNVIGPAARRKIDIIDAHGVPEQLVLFEDGELLRTVTDPDFHVNSWDGI